MKTINTTTMKNADLIRDTMKTKGPKEALKELINILFQTYYKIYDLSEFSLNKMTEGVIKYSVKEERKSNLFTPEDTIIKSIVNNGLSNPKELLTLWWKRTIYESTKLAYPEKTEEEIEQIVSEIDIEEFRKGLAKGIKSRH